MDTDCSQAKISVPQFGFISNPEAGFIKVENLNDFIILFNVHLSSMHNLKLPLLDSTTTGSGDKSYANSRSHWPGG
jgi:hypothetical protein